MLDLIHQGLNWIYWTIVLFWFFFIVPPGVTGCTTEQLARLESPGGAWIAIVHEDTCSDGKLTTTIDDIVEIASTSAPDQRDDVLILAESGHPEYRPVLAWTGPEILRITVPNFSLIGLRRQEFGAVKVELKFDPDDPAARRKWRQSLDLPPDG